MHQSHSPAVDRRSGTGVAASNNNNPAMTATNHQRPQNSGMSAASSFASWVCPSDRQLMLRAMLGAGWSNRSRDPSSPMRPSPFPPPRDNGHSNGAESPSRELISEEEKRHIADILRKAEQSKRVEQTRIESLKSRVQALKVQTRGDGSSTCLLCGEQLGMFKRAAKCDICAMRFCDKCSALHQSRTGTHITLCRVCYEQREVWKRSGAWLNGELPDIIEPPSRSVSILSNSSSNKGGVVDPNALLGGTGWRRYRSIHGHTTVLKPGRTAVLSESADTDSESEFDSAMIGDNPAVPQTERLPRKFPVEPAHNTENASSATAPSSPTPSRHTTFYDQLSMRTEVASRLLSYAVSRMNMGWNAVDDKPIITAVSGSNASSAPQSPHHFSASKDSGVAEIKQFAFQPEPIMAKSLISTTSEKILSNEDLTTGSSASAGNILHACSPTHALSSPLAGSAAESWSNARSTGQPSDDSATDDAQSTTSSTAIAPSGTFAQGKASGSRADLASVPSNNDRASLKSFKLSDHDDNLCTPACDSSSVRSLDVQNAACAGVSRSKSARPVTLSAAVSGPICSTKSVQSPDQHDSPSTLAPANTYDRRRLSADVGRLLEQKSLPTSASSSKVALVIAASTATSFLAAPHAACSAAVAPPTATRLVENNATHKTSTSDLSSPTSSMSSVSASCSQRKLNQGRDNSNAATAECSDVDSEVAYQLPNGGPSIAITEPGNAPDGTLHFTLMYDTAASTLICRIISAKDLASKDMNGLSDPYVKVEMLPDPCKASQFKTNVVKKCLNPTWDETIVYEGVLEEDMKNKTLRLQVLDKDPIGYDFIGEARTTLSCLPTDRLLSYNVVLKPAMKEPKLLSGAPLLDVGRIRLTFLYNSAESVFSVSGLRLARLARSAKKSNKDPPSPIIMIRLLLQSAPGTNQNAFTTTVQKRCVNCNFGAADTFKEKVSLKELAKRVVDVSVWDSHVNKADCLLGSVQFGITSHGHQLRHFYQAVKTTDIAHTRWHALVAPPSGSTSGTSSTSISTLPAPSGKQSAVSSPVVGAKRFQ